MKMEVDTAARREKRMSRCPMGPWASLFPLACILRVPRPRAAWKSPREASSPAAHPEDTKSPVVPVISLRDQEQAREAQSRPRPLQQRPAPAETGPRPHSALLPAQDRGSGLTLSASAGCRFASALGTRGSHPAHAQLPGAQPVPPAPAANPTPGSQWGPGEGLGGSSIHSPRPPRGRGSRLTSTAQDRPGKRRRRLISRDGHLCSAPPEPPPSTHSRQ